MNINTIIVPELIINLKSTDKEKVLDELINLIKEQKTVPNIQTLKKKIFYRESLMSTGIGLHIGIPHVRMEGFKRPIIAIGIQPEGILNYEAIDNLPVKLVVMIICGATQHKIHIKILSQIVSLLKKNELFNQILIADNTSEVYRLFTEKSK